MATFTPPTVEYRYSRLWKIQEGVTVINNSGTFTEKQYPSQIELDAATEYWLGGHVYDITTAQADALTAAGYGDYIT